jgi:HEAT repeat protein
MDRAQAWCDIGRLRLRRLRAPDAALASRYDRLYVPRNDPRWLRRNALVALGNVGGDDDVPLVERFLDDPEPAVAAAAARAAARIAERA